MLESIEFRNYRCFGQHTVPLKQETIIVGRNNAGKSTFIEGLRFISVVTERYRHLNFSDVPRWLDKPSTHRGVRPSLDGFAISLENIFFQYSEPPAQIIAKFTTGESIEVSLGENSASHSVIRDKNHRIVSSRTQAQDIDLPLISVLPQVAPLQKEEVHLNDDYVRRSMSSILAPAHFRNQLRLLYDEHFANFRSQVETTWPGVRIKTLENRFPLDDKQLLLMVQDDSFVAEISWMGHGLQMWLQIMWFLTRVKPNATIILDEPDVFMHPDLQRRLMKLLRGRFAQVIIATHSTEILCEVDSSNILILDRANRESSFATNLPAVQQILENLGSVQNLALTRLWSARRILLVEGQDLGILKRLHQTLFPKSPTSIDALPNMPINGWSGWNYAVGTQMFLKNGGDQDILVYCILDADYHTDAEKLSRYRDASIRGIELHIWSRKEIENYLLCPSAIHRLLMRLISSDATKPSEGDIQAKIDELGETRKDHIIDSVANEWFLKNKDKGIQYANRNAREHIAKHWDMPSERIRLLPGKEMLSALFQWCQESYGISLNAGLLAQEIRGTEMPVELISLLDKIERGVPLRTAVA